MQSFVPFLLLALLIGVAGVVYYARKHHLTLSQILAHMEASNVAAASAVAGTSIAPPPSNGVHVTTTGDVTVHAGGASPASTASLPTGVSLVDKENGLVAFDPSINPALAGQSFCVFPALALFDKGSQAAATIIFNTANAKGAEVNGLGLWIRVSKVVANVGGAAFAPFKLPVPPEWIDKAWTFGSELNTWDAVLTAAKHWHAPVELPSK